MATLSSPAPRTSADNFRRPRSTGACAAELQRRRHAEQLYGDQAVLRATG